MEKNKRVSDSTNDPKVDNKNDYPGYPMYPASEDIYNKSSDERNEIPDDVTAVDRTAENEIIGFDNGEELDGHIMGDDLDVPGSELDDDDEIVGNEDEANNYYSLGGDEHNDLTEDQGDD